MKPIEFIHLSDIHISVTYGDLIKRLSHETGDFPTSNLIRFFKKIQTAPEEVDFIVITGDLSNDGSTEDYAYIKALFERELPHIPIHVCLGNHDNRTAFFKGYLNQVNPSDAYYNETVMNEDFGIIALDTGAEYEGVLSSKQLQWLTETLKVQRKNGRILLLHHPPCIYKGESILSYYLKNADALYDVIKDSDISCIFSGHTHQNITSMFGHIPSYTVGSPAFGTEFYRDYMTFNNLYAFNHCTISQGEIAVLNKQLNFDEKKLNICYDNFQN